MRCSSAYSRHSARHRALRAHALGCLDPAAVGGKELGGIDPSTLRVQHPDVLVGVLIHNCLQFQQAAQALTPLLRATDSSSNLRGNWREPVSLPGVLCGPGIAPVSDTGRMDQLNELGFYVLAGAPQSPVGTDRRGRARARRSGLGSTFISERFNIKEAFTLSGAVGAVSSTLGIATAATNHNTRHPMVTASHATTMHRLTGGRFTLGLGRGIAPLFDAYGIPRDHHCADRGLRRHHAPALEGRGGVRPRRPGREVPGAAPRRVLRRGHPARLRRVRARTRSRSPVGASTRSCCTRTSPTRPWSVVSRPCGRAAEAAGPRSRVGAHLVVLRDDRRPSPRGVAAEEDGGPARHLPPGLRRSARRDERVGSRGAGPLSGRRRRVDRSRARSTRRPTPGCSSTSRRCCPTSGSSRPRPANAPAVRRPRAAPVRSRRRRRDHARCDADRARAGRRRIPRHPTREPVRPMAREPGVERARLPAESSATRWPPNDPSPPSQSSARARAGSRWAIALDARGLRLHDLREVRRRRRYVARQRVSRRGVRRAVAPLLVLVRAEPVVEPYLRDAARDPRVPRTLHRPVRRPSARPHDIAIARRAGTSAAQRSGRSTTATRRDVRLPTCVVSGLGMLNVPVVPDIPGAERFRGRSFHSSRWDHSKSLAGERVGSIGTGASAIQYVPAIAPEVEHLTVFQRTPIWITPRIDRPFTPEEQRRFARVPVRGAHRTVGRSGGRTNAPTSRPTPSRRTMQTELARSYLERKIADPELRAKLTPDYPVGCKRPLISREWFPALTRPNVRLVTEPIVEITEARRAHRRRRRAPRRHDHLRHRLPGERIPDRGRHLRPRRPAAARRLAATAPRRTSASPCPGYPNLFLLYGPEHERRELDHLHARGAGATT